MNTADLNKLSRKDIFCELEKCCGSRAWVEAMIKQRPFTDIEHVVKKSGDIWSKISKQDILEAFNHHPQIGDIESIKTKFSNTASLAGNEQKGASEASLDILQCLKNENENYYKKFGFIFIVCATGKSAQEMLDLLNQRMSNHEAIELHIAAAEQNKITHLRLKKLFGN